MARDIAICANNNRKRKVEQASLLVWDFRQGSTNPFPMLNVPGLKLSNEEVHQYKFLIKACKTGDASVVRDLLDSGASPKPPDIDAKHHPFLLTPLEAAAHGNHQETVRLLLGRGLALSGNRNTWTTSSSFSAAAMQTKKTMALLAKHKSATQLRQFLPEFTEIVCVCRFPATVVSKLINVGLWSDRPGPMTRYTPLGNVIRKLHLSQDFDLLRLLLNDPARRNSRCHAHEPWYPIHVACKSDSQRALKILLDGYQANPDHGNARGEYAPLQIAAGNRAMSAVFVETLLNAGASAAGDSGFIDPKFGLAAQRLLFKARISKRGLDEPATLLVKAARLGDIEVLTKLPPICSRDERLAIRRAAGELFKGWGPRLTDTAVVTLPWVTNRVDQMTGFALMLKDGDEKQVQTLLASGQLLFGDIPARKKSKMMCLAAQCQPLEVLEALLDRLQARRPSRHVLETFYTETGQNALAPACTPEGRQPIDIPRHELLEIDHHGANKLFYRCFLAAVEADIADIVDALAQWCPDYVRPSNNNEEVLFCGIKKNQISFIKALIEAGTDPLTEYTDKYAHAATNYKIYGRRSTQSAISCAAQYGRTEILQCMLDYGGDVNTKNTFRQSLLVLAAAGGHADTVRLLIERGAILYARDVFDRTPLHWAVLEHNEPITCLLLDAGAKLDSTGTSTDADEYARLWALLFDGFTDLQITLKQTFRGHRHAERELNNTVKKKSAPIFRFMLERGAQQIKAAGGLGLNRLFDLGLFSIMTACVEHGLVHDEVDYEGRTWVRRAVDEGSHELVRAFVKAGFDVCTPDLAGNTPLSCAEDDEMVAALYSGTR